MDPITNESVGELVGRQVNLKTAAAYSPKLIAALAEKFPVESIVNLLVDLSTATAITKGGREVDDYRTRLAAATLLLNYLVGRPVERQEIINVNVDADSEAGMMDRMAKSPALRASIRKILDAADRADATEV